MSEAETTTSDEDIDVYHVTPTQLHTMITALGNVLINLAMTKKVGIATEMIAGILDNDIAVPAELLAGWLVECAVDNIARIGFEPKLSETYAEHHARHNLNGDPGSNESFALEAGTVDLARTDRESALSMLFNVMGDQEKAERGMTLYKLAVIAVHAASGYITSVAECDGHHE